MSKKCKSKRRAPAHAFGLESAIGVGQQALPMLTSTLGLGEDASTIINDVGSLGMTGMQLGGPVGAGIGAGVGLVKGIFGVNANQERRRMERRSNIRKMGALGMDINNSIGNGIGFDYFNENSPNIPTYKYGYVNDNEIIQYTNNKLSKVNGNPNVTDSELIDMSNVKAILSDDLKIDGSNETFAQAGDKLRRISNKAKNAKGRLGANSRRLNQEYVDNSMIGLQVMQAEQKAKLGKKTKSKPIPAYANGLEDDILDYGLIGPEATITYSAPMNTLAGNNGSSLSKRIANFGKKPYTSERQVTPFRAPTPGDYSFYNPADIISELGNDQYAKPINYNTPAEIIGEVSQTKNSTDSLPKADRDIINNDMDYLGIASGLLTDYLALDPYRYNRRMANKPAEHEAASVNPNNDVINRIMRSRRINARPMLQRLDSARAASAYNDRNMSGSQKQLYRLASERQFANAENDILNTIQQANNGYIGEYANMLNNLGQQYANARFQANDINARNRAARDSFGSTASTQLSQWAQNKSAMINQQNRDKGLSALLDPYMRSGIDSATWSKIRGYFPDLMKGA